MLRFRSSGRSHTGRVREHNEDSGYAGPYLLLVADGVGGAAAGEVASASTTYVTACLANAATDPDLVGLLDRAVRHAHLHLRDGVNADPSRAGMATTLTAVLTDGERFAVAHVGDSRAYLLRSGALTRISRDHTLVQQLLDEHRISREQAARHPYQSVVLRSVDADHDPEPDLAWLTLHDGDRLLLCSDGLSDLVSESDIVRLLGRPDLDAAVDSLLAAALEAGGRDNITCVAADVITGPRIRPDGALLGAVADLDNLVDPAAVRLDRSA